MQRALVRTRRRRPDDRPLRRNHPGWRWLAPRLLALVALAACEAPGATVSPPPEPTTTTATASPDTTNTFPTSTTDPATACPEGDVMVADGQILQFDRPTADGTRIAGITWSTAAECLTVTVSFATEDGAPATTPPAITASVLRSAGVLRVATGATSSVIADQLMEEDLAERLFVPVDAEGERFIDIVLEGPAVARARVLTSPARLEIELEAGGPDDMGSPLISSELVVTEPGSNATAEPILDVTGYSIGDLEAVMLTVLAGEEVVTETELELASQPQVWTGFAITLPVGDVPYDNLTIATDDESVVAGIPFSR